MIDAVLSLNSVARVYSGPDPVPALRGATLSFGPGEFVAVVGRSGSGKSTLLNLIGGLDRPSTGEVHAAGVNLETLSEGDLSRWRGRNVGIVFQFFQLLPTLTVAENIALAMDFVGCVPSAAREAKARALLGRVGIPEQADKLPGTLSGGQQQRAAIARALANDPPILLADEPTGNLDDATASGIVALLSVLAREGTTVVVVTHDEEIARRADRVVRLADGWIVQDERICGGAR